MIRHVLDKLCRFWLVLIGIVWISITLVTAQDTAHIVPDLTGLNLPQAAAALHRAGLRLGAQYAQPWQADSAGAPHTITGQSIAAGEALAYGTAVDVDIFSASRVRLIYDDNELTLLNDTGGPLRLAGITFHSDSGQFAASNWRNNLPAGDCTQVWSVLRRNAKRVEGCASIFWMTTTTPAEHFWTQTSGTQRFQVMQGDIMLATCDAAPQNAQGALSICDFFIINANRSAANTRYLYLAYTVDSFMAVNTSSDAWMPLTETAIYANAPQPIDSGTAVYLGRPPLFSDVETVADVGRLAPGQCVLLVNSGGAAPPEACDLIAWLTVGPESMFWTTAFEVAPATRAGERITCPAASPDQVTICVMAR